MPNPFDKSAVSDYLALMNALTDLFDEYEFLEADDRYRLLIDLGKGLEPMPDALKTDATLVRGCSAAVRVYPTVRADGALPLLAASNRSSDRQVGTEGVSQYGIRWARVLYKK